MRAEEIVVVVSLTQEMTTQPRPERPLPSYGMYSSGIIKPVNSRLSHVNAPVMGMVVWNWALVQECPSQLSSSPTHTYPWHDVPFECDIEWHTPQVGTLISQHKRINRSQLLEFQQCRILRGVYQRLHVVVAVASYMCTKTTNAQHKARMVCTR